MERNDNISLIYKKAREILNDFLNRDINLDPLTLNNEILLSLLGYPNKKIQNKIWNFLYSKDPNIFHKKMPNPFWKSFSEKQKAISHGFTLYLLLELNPTIYLLVMKEIKSNFSVYRNYLIEKLIDPVEIISNTAAKLLYEAEFKDLYDQNYELIFSKLDLELQVKLINQLKPRLESSNWHLRENGIRLLMKFQNPDILDFIQKYRSDPDSNVRWTIAVSLGNFKHPLSFEMLYEYLLDNVPEIQQEARQSLEKVLPGLYRGKSTTDILIQLGKEYPVQLLHICPKSQWSDSIHRIWRNLGYDGDLLEKYHLLANEKMLVEISENQNPRGMIEQHAINLLLYSRVPTITALIESKLNKVEDQILISKLHSFLDIIHQKFTVEQSTGFNFLL